MGRFSRVVAAFLFAFLMVPDASGAIQSPDDDALVCVGNDDSDCAVEVWERAFQLNPLDPYVKDSFFLALLFDVTREIDKGNLPNARVSFDRAVQLFPTGPTRSEFLPIWSYLRDSLNLYDSNLFAYDMTPPYPFRASESVEHKSEYVTMEGRFAQSTSVFALTQKVVEWWNYYLTGPVDGDVAFRTSVFLSNQNGMAQIIIGGADRQLSEGIVLSIGWNFGDYFATWRLDRVRGDIWDPILRSSSVDIAENSWFALEIRARGKTLEIYLNQQLLGQATVFDYEPGYVGIGAALMVGGTTSYFTAAFDDMAAYQIAT